MGHVAPAPGPGWLSARRRGYRRRVPGTLSRTLPAVPDSVPSLRQAVDAFAEAAGATPETLLGVRLAISEAVSNVVHHAYVGREAGSVELTARVDGQVLVVVVGDDGIGPRTERPDSPGSGFGLRLIGASTDGFELRGRDDGVAGSQLEMHFRL